MSRRPWYKRYPSDFIAGTLQLSCEEKGAYSVVLDLIYDRGGPIPDDAQWIARVCNLSTRRWNQIRARLLELGKVEAIDGVLTNKRALSQLKVEEKEHISLSSSGKLGAEKTNKTADVSLKNNGLEEKGPPHKNRHTRSQKPEIRKKETPSGVSKENPGELILTPPENLDRSGFKAWWKLYPKKVGRDAAEQNYRTALRTRKATSQELLAGLVRAVAFWDAEGTETKFIIDPERWLKKGKWKDDLTVRKKMSTREMILARGADHGDPGTSFSDGDSEPQQLGPPAV